MEIALQSIVLLIIFHVFLIKLITIVQVAQVYTLTYKEIFEQSTRERDEHYYDIIYN